MVTTTSFRNEGIGLLRSTNTALPAGAVSVVTVMSIVETPNNEAERLVRY